MKLLLVTPYYYPKIGGLENYARQLGVALHELKKWDIVVVTSNHAGTKTEVGMVDDMKIYRLKPLFKFSNTPVNPLWPLHIKKIIRAEKPDAILAHSPVPTMADAAALAAGKVPFILTYHAATLKKDGSLIFNLVAGLYQAYEHITFRKARTIIAVSDYVKQTFSPAIQEKTVVVANGVWKKDIVSRKQPSTTNFIFIGSLDKTHAWKGLGLIIEAVHEYTVAYKTDCHLTVIGDGNARSIYEGQVAKLGIGTQVTFLGALQGADKDRQLSKATALIMYPVTGNDAFPTVMLEAWAKEVPVVAGAMGPIPSLMTDGVDGFLAKPNDPKALANAMYHAASSNLKTLAEISDAAARRTTQQYTWERHADEVESIVRRLI